MIPLFYFVNWALQAKKVTDFLEHSGLEAKLLCLREYPLFTNYSEEVHPYNELRKVLILIGEDVYKELPEINKYIDLLSDYHS